FFFFQAEDGIRDWSVTGVQTCALPILMLFLGQTGTGKTELAKEQHHRCRLGRIGHPGLDEPQLGRDLPDRVVLAEHHLPEGGRRSEERRVGKEWRARGGAGDYEKREGI